MPDLRACPVTSCASGRIKNVHPAPPFLPPSPRSCGRAPMTRTNRIFFEITVGETASITRVVTPEDLYVFAHVSGNLNPCQRQPEPGQPAGQPRHQRAGRASGAVDVDRLAVLGRPGQPAARSGHAV